MKRNGHLAKLKGSYLFPEITQRKRQFMATHPEAQLISLGIGDTTQPIAPCIAHALAEASTRLATLQGYSGYGPEAGLPELREKIASVIYQGRVKSDEIFISDGAKCDLGRLQLLFGNDVSIAVQDPAYPVYIEGSLILGVQKLIPMPCLPDNDFFPDLSQLPRTDLIYFCSPNNPTGATASREQLQQLVAFAERNRSIIIFDSAYSSFIQDPSIPRSIFEIEGACRVALEIGSFSKLAGFTGLRLGWSVIPHELYFDDGTAVRTDWNRLLTTVFNGASNLAQIGGCTALEREGLKEIKTIIGYYQENCKLLKTAFKEFGCDVYGGVNAPYLWLHFPGASSWDLFQQFMERFHIVTTPGSGFGPSGEGFIRLTSFGHRHNILQATERVRSGWNISLSAP